MTDFDPVEELAGRAGVSRAAAQAVLEALEAMAAERAAGLCATPALAPLAFVPTSGDVDALIETAAQHPLGLEFLLHGELGAVAVTFGAHAFTVDAARSRLRGEPEHA